MSPGRLLRHQLDRKCHNIMRSSLHDLAYPIACLFIALDVPQARTNCTVAHHSLSLRTNLGAVSCTACGGLSCAHSDCRL